MGYKPNLQKGDFIAVADSGIVINLGWFIGYGNNSLLYYNLWMPSWAKETILKEDPPLQLKQLRKAYITSIYPGRVIKITDPESAFWKPEQLEWYENGIEVLTMLKFLN